METVAEQRFAALMRGLEAATSGVPRRPFRPAAKAGDTELVGGPGGMPFRVVSPTGENMIGIRCTTRKWMREDHLGSVEPLFAAAAAGPTVLLAKPGYVLGAVEVDAGAFVSAIRVTFVRLEGGRLNPGDYYRSEWLGRPTGRPTRMLDAKGARVVGICGRRGVAVNALGLVTEGNSPP